METAGKLHHFLKHRVSLYIKIWDHHQQCDASQRHNWHTKVQHQTLYVLLPPRGGSVRQNRSHHPRGSDTCTLGSVSAAILVLTPERNSTEQAHAAQGGSCWMCGERDHLSRDFPHREAIQQLVTKGRTREADHTILSPTYRPQPVQQVMSPEYVVHSQRYMVLHHSPLCAIYNAQVSGIAGMGEEQVKTDSH